MTKHTKEEVYERIVKILSSDFEIDAAKISPESNLFEDLELDSIDAVDLAVRLQQYTNKKISPEEFKDIRTVEDVAAAVYNLLN